MRCSQHNSSKKPTFPPQEPLPTPDTVERHFSAASQLQNNRGFSPRGKASYQGMASAAMPQPPAKMRLQALARVGRTLLSAACAPPRSKHPVILSVAVPSRSEGIAESKDPCTLNSAGSSTTFSSHPIPPKPALVADPLFLIFFPTRDFVCRKGSPNPERACHQPIPHRNRSSTLKSPGVVRHDRVGLRARDRAPNRLGLQPCRIPYPKMRLQALAHVGRTLLSAA